MKEKSRCPLCDNEKTKGDFRRSYDSDYADYELFWFCDDCIEKLPEKKCSRCKKSFSYDAPIGRAPRLCERCYLNNPLTT